MKITYDRDADALAILLADTEVHKTKSIAPGVEVDYDVEGRVVAIEFLNAGQKYDLNRTELEAPSPFCSLIEAGTSSGLSSTTLRHQIERGVLQGVKFGRNWMVHQDDLDAYVKKRSRKARADQGR